MMRHVFCQVLLVLVASIMLGCCIRTMFSFGPLRKGLEEETPRGTISVAADEQKRELPWHSALCYVGSECNGELFTSPSIASMGSLWSFVCRH